MKETECSKSFFPLIWNPVDFHTEPDNEQPCIIWLFVPEESLTVGVYWHTRACIYVKVYIYVRICCNCLFIPDPQKNNSGAAPQSCLGCR